MKKHWKAFCLIICLSVMVLTGCIKDDFRIEEETQKETYLKFAGYKVGENKVEEIEKILNAYMEENKDTVVVYEGIKYDYVEIMTNRIENNHADDLFMISDQALTTYEEKGWFGTKIMDLSDKEFVERYNPLIKDLFTVDGKIAAIPMCMSVVGMIANMDVLEACGISEMPQTYNEWVTAMRLVKEHGYTPMVNYQGNAASFNFLIAARAVAPYVEQGISYEGEASAQLYEKGIRDIYALMEEGLIDREQAIGETESRSYQKVLGEQFAAGNIAFAVMPNWCITSFLEGNPDFSYQFGGLPMGENGPLVDIRASVLVGINNEGENKEKAEEFLDYLMRAEYIEEYAADQNGLSPLAGAQTDNEMYTDILPLIEEGRFTSDTDSRIEFNLVKRLNYVSKQMLEQVPIEQILNDFDKGVADEE